MATRTAPRVRPTVLVVESDSVKGFRIAQAVDSVLRVDGAAICIPDILDTRNWSAKQHLDVQLPIMQWSLSLLDQAASFGVSVPWLCLYEHDEDVAWALSLHAAGAIHREASPTRIAYAAASVLEGDYILPRSFGANIRRVVGDPGESPTNEDIVLLQVLVRGDSLTDAATLLSCSERHLRRRVAALCLRMGVPNRTQAVALAVRRPWI